jgi:serine/threonine-protein kinase HipA
MICFGCFKENELPGYCKKCLKELFDGEKVHHVLPFNSPVNEESTLYTDLTTKMSISGVQVKYSLKLEGRELKLTDKGGQYILKPVPVGQFKNLDQAPANEHLTMQLAKQFFKIAVPANAIVFFQDGNPAYLVRRFDVKSDGSKYQQEDFAQIAGVTEATHGKNYKYDLSYEEIGALMKKHIPTYKVEVEKFFRLVLFNYVFSNGDAHVKNFSVIQSESGDYILTPAYDLLCTRIHTPNEADMALTLFKGRFSAAYDAVGFYTNNDFVSFGNVLGMKENRVTRIINEFKTDHNDVHSVIQKSFLNEEMKTLYTELCVDRIKRLKMEWGNGL